MATDMKALKIELARIKRELEALEARIGKIEGQEAGPDMPFAKMRGIWRGKVHFTDEEIEAAKIRVMDFP